MSATEAPKPAPAGAPSKAPATNRIGHTLQDYKGAASTLCAGCGHDSITSQIQRALFESGVNPYNVAKMSGIGCSSKTTAYFLSLSHGFNSVHGRAPAVATGSYLANRELLHICVSGDGDTASIGLGHFMHMMRRNVPMVYIIENNGVYGLTKGQFSATADKGSTHKKGFENEMMPIDACALAIEMGCDYVARSFSGDIKQLVPLLKGAMCHGGTSIVDVVSPCVTFNNHEGSTKSLKFARENEEPLQEIGFVPYYDEIKADYPEGTMKTIELTDGSKLTLKKLERDYDPSDKMRALDLLQKARDERLFLTGLLYHNPNSSKGIADQLNMVDVPLAHLPESVTVPSAAVLAEIMEEYK
ncbi:MAG: 2-oxoacid:ferredoxin oxidoreductase subunit beta [Candidatus Sumerlaeaceae bacterium]|nr:2-oxoacid:ferredoxin oxidoreductase subunit beta [Candidatus Sumerlaeaceae bacterium]